MTISLACVSHRSGHRSTCWSPPGAFLACWNSTARPARPAVSRTCWTKGSPSVPLGVARGLQSAQPVLCRRENGRASRPGADGGRTGLAEPSGERCRRPRHILRRGEQGSHEVGERRQVGPGGRHTAAQKRIRLVVGDRVIRVHDVAIAGESERGMASQRSLRFGRREQHGKKKSGWSWNSFIMTTRYTVATDSTQRIGYPRTGSRGSTRTNQLPASAPLRPRSGTFRLGTRTRAKC